MPKNNQINELTRLFQQNTHEGNALRMAHYMKNHFPFFGIKSPLRRDIMKIWWGRQKFHDESELQSLMSDLWKMDEREYQYVACDLGKSYKKLWTPESLPFIQQLICTKSWWDTVDVMASHMVGSIEYCFPNMDKVMDAWIAHPNMWIRRTAILHQLSFKERTTKFRLFDYCTQTMHEKEFFIQKAIGWALRQYSYIEPNSVIKFVNNNKAELSTLSKTEALKALKRKGKI